MPSGSRQAATAARRVSGALAEAPAEREGDRLPSAERHQTAALLLVPVDVILADADADRHGPVLVGVGG